MGCSVPVSQNARLGLAGVAAPHFCQNKEDPSSRGSMQANCLEQSREAGPKEPRREVCGVV